MRGRGRIEELGLLECTGTLETHFREARHEKGLGEAVGVRVVTTELIPLQAPAEAEYDLEPHHYITACNTGKVS